MGPNWGRQNTGGPHVGHVKLAIWNSIQTVELLTPKILKVSDALCRMETSLSVINDIGL